MMQVPPPEDRQSGWQLRVKAATDRSVALLGLTLGAPALLAAAASVWVTMGCPVFFSQLRPGRDARLFRVYKFRTMRDARGPDSAPLPDGDRLTRVGRILRATSIDEFPQLWNVLRGELSLVGPRPLLQEYLSRYTPEQARRHEVLPGITGWAQVHGRNAITWEEKFALDVWYVDHWSLGLDARILAMTFWKVVARQGISSAGHATMPEFMGEAGKVAKEQQGNP
jgi:lipopolysaccharide/colanic/teichoic acid biosynthesis glycosyltransferase